MFVLLLALYSCITIPLHLSFLPEVEAETRFGYFIDVCFFLDIIVTFRTTSVNLATGEEIIHSKEIASRYLKGRFMIDFLSAVPIDKIVT